MKICDHLWINPKNTSLTFLCPPCFPWPKIPVTPYTGISAFAVPRHIRFADMVGDDAEDARAVVRERGPGEVEPGRERVAAAEL